jgi:hypothetical protein
MIARLFSCSLGIPPAVAHEGQEWNYQLGRISLVVPLACMKGVQLLVSDVVSLVLYAWTLARQPTMFVDPFSYISAIEGQVRWRLALQPQVAQDQPRTHLKSLDLVTYWGRILQSSRDVGRQLKY